MLFNFSTKLKSEHLKWLKVKFFPFFVAFRLPFEWRTPIGYLIAFSIQFASFYCILLSADCFMGFLIGSCETLLTLTEDVKTELSALDDANKSGENAANLKQQMCDFVDLHSNTRQLSEMKYQMHEIHFWIVFNFFYWFNIILRFARDFSYIYENIITAIFLWSLSNICSGLLIIQIELVKYFSVIRINVWSFKMIKHFLFVEYFTEFGKCDWLGSSDDIGFLVICCNFFVVQFWWTSFQSARRYYEWYLWVWLVCVPNWTSKDVTDDYHSHSKAGHIPWLWKYFGHTRNLYEGIYAIFGCKNLFACKY